MDLIMSHGVALCRKSQTTVPEINLSPSTLWKTSLGGMSRRFNTGFYKDVRLTDPWSGEVLRFHTLLHADNWLLRAFDPTCRIYSLVSAPMRVLDRGQFLSVQFFAMGNSLDGQTFADFVVKKETRRTEANWQHFQIAARAHRVVPVKRGIEQIRGNLTLLENLETMRSHLVRHIFVLQEAVRITPHILKSLTGDPLTIAGLMERLDARRMKVNEATLHFALFRAYRRAELHLDVCSRPYSLASVVSARQEP